MGDGSCGSWVRVMMGRVTKCDPLLALAFIVGALIFSAKIVAMEMILRTTRYEINLYRKIVIRRLNWTMVVVSLPTLRINDCQSRVTKCKSVVLR